MWNLEPSTDRIYFLFKSMEHLLPLTLGYVPKEVSAHFKENTFSNYEAIKIEINNQKKKVLEKTFKFVET